MKLFLDTSVLLAAAGSRSGASREVFRRADTNAWELIATPYTLEETLRNLGQLGPSAVADWAQLREALNLAVDVVTLDRPSAFTHGKDRPILFSALAWADVLLTLDRIDFGALLNSSFYGLDIVTPGMFLERERAHDRLR